MNAENASLVASGLLRSYRTAVRRSRVDLDARP